MDIGIGLTRDQLAKMLTCANIWNYNIHHVKKFDRKYVY